MGVLPFRGGAERLIAGMAAARWALQKDKAAGRVVA